MRIIKNIACFDIGGSFIKYAVINEEGQILIKDKFATPKTNSKENILDEIVKKIDNLKEEHTISSVGICVPGQVDIEKGKVLFCANVKELAGVNLSDVIYERTNLECFVDNDVNAAALGEMWMGAAKGKETFVCIALGTGIGGAIVINGNIFRGMGGNAGEVGHMIVNTSGEKCNCGLKGCYEKYASTSALIRNYVKTASINDKDKRMLQNIDGEEIINRVNKGEELAEKVYDEFLDDLTIGLVNVVHILDPGLIVLGGGISAQGQPFVEEINKRLNKRIMTPYRDYTKVILAELQNDAGLLGACYIAK